ncbi:MAG: general secretion pathway protein GspK [Phycisphaeraceae bacterium]|nr:general secretion pathway protein GspK [Phycisphaeraceae bacterium]
MAALTLVAVQTSALEQSNGGRMTVARTKAYWAARAGVESQIAALTFATLQPDPGSALAVMSDLEGAASGEWAGVRFEVAHDTPTARRAGAADAHAKLSVNAMSKNDLMLLPDMDDAIADAILDWIDTDDEPREFGAEIGQYTGLAHPYTPRDAPMRSLRELELVSGVRPEYVRGEDWNLNGLLDANEDDGVASPPDDNADGKLDAGWSEHLTASSTSGPGWAASGRMRLDLTGATESDLMQRLNVDQLQAQAILTAVQNDSSLSLADFIRTDLSQLASGQTDTVLGGVRLLTPRGPAVQSLSREQLGALLDECTIGDPLAAPDALSVRVGKLNINTVDDRTLEYVSGITPAIRDGLLIERQSRSGGFVSLVDLMDVPSISNAVLADLYEVLDVRSHGFVVTSRGVDEGTGITVEIVTIIDRSRLPVEVQSVIIR